MPVRTGSAVATVLAALFVIAPHRSPDTPALRALPGPVEEVYADPVNVMYRYGPSALEREVLQAVSAFTSNITVTYDAGFSANPQAKLAFQAAVDIWRSVIASPAPIRVRASFSNLGNPNVLGSAGPSAVCSTNQGIANTAYAAALADKLNRSAFCATLSGAASEITANFNSTFTNWDFGTSGAPVPGKYNFLTVVMHELGHGLGFYGSMSASGGIGRFGYGPSFPNVVDVFDRFAVTGAGAALIAFANPSAALGAQLVSNNTFFNGGNSRLNNGGINPKLETHNFTTQYGAPSDGGFLGGSSYSHLDDVLYSATPNGLMTWSLGQAEVYTDPGPIVRGIFSDAGWTITSSCSYTLSSSSFNIGAKGTTSSVSVAAGAGCGWNAASNASWLTVIGGAAGSGNGTVTYTVAANSGGTRTGTLTIAGQVFTVVQAAARTSRGDFDGDATADISVFRPSTGSWFIYSPGTGTGATYTWGGGGDIPLAGDFDGDGRSDVTVFRPSTGAWYIRFSSGGSSAVTFGGFGDIPVPGDYNGDGITDIAVFRPSTGTWYLGTGTTLVFGGGGDIPVPADYDGDGRTDIGIFRPSTGAWYLTTGAAFVFGGGGDIPVPGDYNGDGRADVAVFRPTTGSWFLGTGAAVVWGGGGDVPTPADYDGDGKTDVAVFRPSTGQWFIIYSGPAVGAAYTFGGAGDIPVMRR